MNTLTIGNTAPLFELLNQADETVKLSDYIGDHGKQVLVYFYPKAMTPGCTTQACAIRDFKKEFSKLKTVVLGVSPDAYPRLQKFIDRDNLNFDLLSDEEHNVADKYGSWGPKKFMGREYDGILRQTFIIGKDGRLKGILDKVRTKTHHEVVLDFIKENL